MENNRYYTIKHHLHQELVEFFFFNPEGCSLTDHAMDLFLKYH